MGSCVPSYRKGLIPVYSIDNHKYEEGSGDIEDDKFVVTKCECSKPSTVSWNFNKFDRYGRFPNLIGKWA
jgi:hypothetical protein